MLAPKANLNHHLAYNAEQRITGMLSNLLDENTIKLVLQLGSCFFSLRYLESFVIVGFSGRGVFKIKFCQSHKCFL